MRKLELIVFDLKSMLVYEWKSILLNFTQSDSKSHPSMPTNKQNQRKGPKTPKMWMGHKNISRSSRKALRKSTFLLNIVKISENHNKKLIYHGIKGTPQTDSHCVIFVSRTIMNFTSPGELYRCCQSLQIKQNQIHETVWCSCRF